jgi:hypothetical protein
MFNVQTSGQNRAATLMILNRELARKFVPKYLALLQAGGSDTLEGSIKPKRLTEAILPTRIDR